MNFPGNLQRCETCHDWIVSLPGQPPVQTCPYCHAAQDTSHAEVKTKGDEVSKRNAALISIRLQQFRIMAGRVPAPVGAATQPTVQVTSPNDPYPAPEGDFTPTIGDVLNDHVLLGNVALIGVDFVFAAVGLIPAVAFLEVLVAVVAVGTVVDTWVHKFFH